GARLSKFDYDHEQALARTRNAFGVCAASFAGSSGATTPGRGEASCPPRAQANSYISILCFLAPLAPVPAGPPLAPHGVSLYHWRPASSSRGPLPFHTPCMLAS